MVAMHLIPTYSAWKKSVELTPLLPQASGIDTWDWSVFQRFQIFDVVHVRESSFPRLTKSFGSLPNTIKEIRFVDVRLLITCEFHSEIGDIQTANERNFPFIN